MKKSKITFYALYVFFMGYIMMGILGWNIIQVGIQLISILLYAYWILKSKKDYEFNLDVVCIVLLVAVYSIGLVVSDYSSGQLNCLNLICRCFVILLSMMYIIKNCRKMISMLHLKQNWSIFLLIILFVSFSLENLNTWAGWDSGIYYSFADLSANTFESTFSNFYNLYLAGHSAAGYALWLILFQMFKQGYLIVQLADIVLACVSIYAYFCIVKKISKSGNEHVATIATMPYAFSPYILGMVGNINVDSVSAYFLVIFIACALYKMEYMEIVVATALCFTKETSIIYYFSYVIGKTFIDFFIEEDLKVKQLVKVLFCRLKNYLYAIPVVLWMIIYRLNPSGGWSNGENTGIIFNNQGMHCFGFNSTNIESKLRQVFFLNFNWVFWLAFLVSLVIIFYNRKQKKEKASGIHILFPIFLTGFSVIIFGVIYITCTHARYIIPLVPCLYLCSLLLFRKTKRGLSCFGCLMGILLLIQSFECIDPFTRAIFPTMSVGEKKIYSMHEQNIVQFHDSIIYNRQYQYWWETLKKVLGDSEYNGDMLIVLPDDMNCGQYNLFGSNLTFWNTEQREMDYYNGSAPLLECQKKMQIVQLSQLDELEESFEQELYIVPAWGTIDENFLKERNIIKDGVVDWRGFRVSYFVLHSI